MTEMVERVAKALVDASANNVWTDKLAQWEAELFARAAMAAMYEPTAAMIDAGSFESTESEDAEQCWKWMIEKALGIEDAPAELNRL